METVQLFCDALRTNPKLEEGTSTAKIHKAEKQHLKYITELFDQLPYRVQRIAINESLKSLLIPKGKTTEQLGLAYALMHVPAEMWGMQARVRPCTGTCLCAKCMRDV